MNEDWVESTFKIHKIYKDLLPLHLHKESSLKIIETDNAKRFIKECLKYKKRSLAFSTWIMLFKFDPISKYSIKFLMLFAKSFSNTKTVIMVFICFFAILI